MMRLLRIFTIGAVLAGATGYPSAQDAQAEKTIIANERAVNDAFAKGNAAGFKEHVAVEGWAIDSMMGRAPVADLVKDFQNITKDLKLTSWDITESKVQWIDANTAVHTYKWTGVGTHQGQPVPSPAWASTVWTKKNGKWTAMFHQESVSMPAPAQKK